MTYVVIPLFYLIMIKAFKKIGQTTLELIEELKQQRPELKGQKLSYAGRLDPMAVGEMWIMVGKDENFNREKFLSNDKTYKVNILFGYQTDTGDLMGLIRDKNLNKKINKKDLKNALKKVKQIKEIKYPVFSSKTVEGKPLFEWYKTGKISEIEIPKRKIKIKKAKLLQTYEISNSDLFNYIENSISLVNGDFRQDKIISRWQDELMIKNDFQVAEVVFKVTTGTYIRSLVDELALILDTKACVFTLNRTKIHKFNF